MQTITDLAANKLNGNHQAIGRLVIMFNKHYRTIEMWIDARDVRLVTPSALTVIMEETGLDESEILTEKEVAKVG